MTDITRLPVVVNLPEVKEDDWKVWAKRLNTELTNILSLIYRYQNSTEYQNMIDDTKGNGDTTYVWSADKIYDQLALKAPVANGYPQRATMWHDEATVISGALTDTIDATQKYAFRTANAADGASFSNSFFLKAGTYTFSALGRTGIGYGKLDWYIDDMVTPVVNGQDWYSATAAPNVEKTASVTVTGDGYHKLVGTTDGQNGSSTGYSISLTKYWFQPATDPARE